MSFRAQTKKNRNVLFNHNRRKFEEFRRVVQFAIYNKEGSIPDEKYKNYYKKDITTIKNNAATIVFNDLPKGKYAINVLHN